LGLDISLAAITGGIIIGIILAIGAYIITYKIVRKIRSREKKGQRGEGRRLKAPAPITASTGPRCAYSTSILCQTETKEQRPRT